LLPTGFPGEGSRNIQWGWYPVGGSQFFDDALTPNDLVSVAQLGVVTVEVTAEPGPAPSPTVYLLDEFAGTGSMDSRAPTVGYNTGNWVNGFNGVTYFTERVDGFLKVLAPDVVGDITYGAETPLITVEAPIRVLFTFNTGPLSSASFGAPGMMVTLITATSNITIELTCYDGVNFNLSLSRNGGYTTSVEPSVAWDTTYSGELLIDAFAQTLTFVGSTLSASGIAWTGALQYVNPRVYGAGGIGRIEITE
jgi:hypothetical protein